MKVYAKEKLVNNPLVSVRVHAYQQESYVRECLDSIISQQTDFDFEIVIGNNPSTDATREILIEYQEKYPEKIVLLLHEENIGFLPNFFETGKACRGKYIARCDGDDYWCDSLKLQKQVELLESNESIGMCYTGSKELFDRTGKLYDVPALYNVDFESMLFKEPMQTLTIMHRREMYERYLQEIHPENKGWLMEDTPINLWYAMHSSIVRLDAVTSVYRVVDGSISHEINYDKQERFNKSLLEIRLFFCEKYGKNDEFIVRGLFNDFYKRNMKAAYSSSNLYLYTRNFVKYKTNNPKEYFSFVKTLLKIIVKKIMR